MGKSTHFIGQPEGEDSQMEETPANNIFHNHNLILQPYIQRCRSTPKNGKKKGGIKVYTVFQTNEGVPSDIRFTSADTNDSFMLKPSPLSKGDIIAMGRA